jgi:hypothetical protein
MKLYTIDDEIDAVNVAEYAFNQYGIWKLGPKYIFGKDPSECILLTPNTTYRMLPQYDL